MPNIGFVISFFTSTSWQIFSYYYSKLILFLSSNIIFISILGRCDECDKFLPSQKGLWVHKQSAHPDTSRILKCRTCEKTFHKRSHLIAHWKTHLNPEQRKPFLNWCKICGKGYDIYVNHFLVENKSIIPVLSQFEQQP